MKTPSSSSPATTARGLTNKSATTAAAPESCAAAKWRRGKAAGAYPAIVRWPGKVRSGEVSDEIASTIDLLPTFATFAKARLAEAKLDGLDLTAFLTKSGAASPRETFLYHNGPRLTAVRHKDWKLVFTRPASGEMPYMPGWLTGHIESLPETQLFNLHTDPAESNNLAAENHAVVKQLTDLAEQSRATLGDYTGPGKEARFFDAGPRWPAAVTTVDSPKNRTVEKKKTIQRPATSLIPPRGSRIMPVRPLSARSRAQPGGVIPSSRESMRRSVPSCI